MEADRQVRGHQVLRKGTPISGEDQTSITCSARDPEPLLTFLASLLAKKPSDPTALYIMWLGGQVLTLPPSVRAGTIGSLRPC